VPAGGDDRHSHRLSVGDAFGPSHCAALPTTVVSEQLLGSHSSVELSGATRLAASRRIRDPETGGYELVYAGRTEGRFAATVDSAQAKTREDPCSCTS
jgi:hypothetical protein